MALVDTGLGWYADENWLKQSSGLMGTINSGGSGGSFIEVPISDTYRQTIIADCYVGAFSPGYSLYEYAMNTGGEPAYFAYIARTDSRRTIFYACRNRATFVSGYIGGGRNPDSAGQLPSYDSASGYWYYSGVSASGPYAPFNESAPVFASLQDALNALPGADGVYYKMNSGYAVSCFAHYLNFNNRLVYAPILISSTPAYTNISKTDPTGGQATDISIRSEFAISDVIFTLGFGEELAGDNIISPGAYVYEVNNTNPLPAPGPILYSALWGRIKKLASIGVGQISPDDPYSGGGTSTPGGGDGTFDFDSTDIDFPGLPSIGGYATGFTTMYNPTATNLKDLADYMWAGTFDYENFRKLFADPMDAIIGLSIVPLTQEQIPGGANTLVVGNIPTGIPMKTVSQQYVKVPMGTVSVPPKWGAYLDYAPYTKLQLFLPYIGFVDIAPDDVVGYSISVEYTVDLLSGTCIALVKTNGHVLYSFGANCSCACPVTSGQYKNGAIGAVEIAGTVASTVSQLTPSLKGLKKGKLVSGIADKVAVISEGALDTFDTVQSMIKPAITRSGSLGSAVGLMGIQIPYLILTVPRMCIPGDQNIYMGYPSFVTQQMSDLLGYTEIQVTHLNGMSCTDVEAAEIISLLERGVIF